MSVTRGQYCSIIQMNTAGIVLNADFCELVTGVFSVRIFKGNSSVCCRERTSSVKCQSNLTRLNTRNTSSDLKLWSLILKQTTLPKTVWNQTPATDWNIELTFCEKIQKYFYTKVLRLFSKKLYLFIFIFFIITIEMTWT